MRAGFVEERIRNRNGNRLFFFLLLIIAGLTPERVKL